MANPTQPSIQLTNTADYRENYANSVQVRVNVWDFFWFSEPCSSRTKPRLRSATFKVST